MFAEVKVLDHGYVRLIDKMGSDEAIIEAARMSTQKGFEGWGPKVTGIPCMGNGEPNGSPRATLPAFLVEIWEKNGRPSYQDATNPWRAVREEPGDEKLLKYLWDHKHATPFEMAEAVFEVQAPIFVFREWHRHRTQSYNEMSARYTPLPDLNYMPTVERLMINSKTNKQAGTVAGAAELTEDAAQHFRELLGVEYLNQETLYQTALTDGVPKELARLVLPVARYSKMRAKANLRNWLAFLTLRHDKAAQWEIREYAAAVHGMLSQHFPRTLSLFDASRAA